MSTAATWRDVVEGRAQWSVECGDCREVLAGLPAGSVDLVLTDPPYFRVKNEWWDRQWDTAAGFLEWLGSLCQEWRRVLKPNGSLYCFASPQMAARVEVEIGRWFNVLNRITWRKEDGWAKRQCKEEQRAFFPASEAIIFAEQHGSDGAVDGVVGYGSQCTDLHKRVYGPVVGQKVQEKRLAAGLQRHQVDSACAPSQKPTGLCYRWEEGACLPTLDQWVKLCRLCGDSREYEDLRRPFRIDASVHHTDVWDFRAVQDYPGKHPCEKPISLIAHIIKASSRPGAVVLDPMCGSGVVLDVARELGRRAIGIDIEQKWAAVAARRLGQALLFPVAAGNGVTTP